MANFLNARIAMSASAECEACGTDIWVDRHLTSSKGFGGLVSARSAHQAVLENIDKQVWGRKERKDYGYNRCPNCNYVQSWMRDSIERTTFNRMRKIGYLLLWVTIIASLIGGLRLSDTIAQELNTSWQLTFVILATTAALIPLALTGSIYLYMASKYRNAVAVKRMNNPVVATGNTPATAYANIGLQYINQNKLSKAIVQFERALEMEPKHALALGGRGFIHFSRGNFPSAISDLRDHARFAGTTAVPTFKAILAQLENAAAELAVRHQQQETPP